MAFGIIGGSRPIILRNFLSFLLRECIRDYEYKAYHNNLGNENAIHIQHAYNAKVKREVFKAFQLLSRTRGHGYFLKAFNPNNCFLLSNTDDIDFNSIPNVFNV